MAAPNNELDSNTPNIRLEARRDLTIGEFVGRDKIVEIIETIYQRALTAAEEAVQARELELQMLAQGVSAVAQSLQHLASRASGPDQRTPYKELVEYDLSDAENFFGRQRAIATLLDKIERGRLAFLHAESGAGKTSLLQAGLAPRLIAAGHLPLYLRAYDLDPALKIKSAFIPELTQAPGLAKASLRGFLKSVCHVLGGDTTLYICLDQFEEFFTHLDVPTRSGFARALADCRDDPSLNVRWVVALRAEFFSEVDSFHPHIRNPFENQYRLERLTRTEAEEAVTRPAARCNLQFETGLVDAILDDLSRGEASIQPPQLQLMCSELFEALKPGEITITRVLYETEGRAEGILGEYLGRVLKRIHDPEQRALAPRLLEALITSDNRRARRRQAALAAELSLGHARAAVGTEMLDALLGQLVNSRLLRVEETEEGQAYELVHDYLLGQIKLDPAVQARKAAQELLDRETRDYERHGTLLSEAKLAIITPRLKELNINNSARALVAKSQQALRRQRGFVLGGVGLVIVLIIVGTLSVISALSANLQRQFAVSTQRAAETAVTGVVALQITSEFKAANAATQEAIARAEQATSEAGAALASTQAAIARETIRRAFENTRLVPVGSGPSALAFDGTRLWVANADDGTVQGIDPTTGDVGAPTSVGDFPIALAFDGARLWVANQDDNTVQAIDPTTGEVSQPLSVGSAPTALAFDGARLWVANQDDNTVQAIDPATGEVSQPLSVGSAPTALTFDGARLWVANQDDNTVQAINPATGEVSQPLSVGSAPTALAFDGTRLWVANWNDHTVQAIDPATGEVSQPLSVGTTPLALAFDGTRLWVAYLNDHTVQAIDPATGEVSQPITVGAFPRALAFDGARLWVANGRDYSVQAIDPTTGDVGVPVPVGPLPTDLIFDGMRLWVAHWYNDTVQAIDPATSEVGAPISVGDIPNALAFDGARLWVANNYDNTVQAIDPATSEVGAPIPVGRGPSALAFDGVRLWIANGVDNTVQAIDLTTEDMSAPIPVGNSPVALAFDGARLWVANVDDDTVQAIDPTTGDVGAPIPVGRLRGAEFPTALAFDGVRLWITNGDDNTVQAIDPATGEAGAPISVGTFPTALAFDGVWLWIANGGDNTVQAMDPTTGEVGVPIPVGGFPIALAFDSDRLWVANYGSFTVQYVLVHR